MHICMVYTHTRTNTHNTHTHTHTCRHLVCVGAVWLSRKFRISHTYKDTHTRTHTTHTHPYTKTHAYFSLHKAVLDTFLLPQKLAHLTKTRTHTHTHRHNYTCIHLYAQGSSWWIFFYRISRTCVLVICIAQTDIQTERQTHGYTDTHHTQT